MPGQLPGTGSLVSHPSADYSVADPAPFEIATGTPAIIVGVNITLISGAGATLTVSVEGYDLASGTWRLLLASAGLVGTGYTPLSIDPRRTAAANSVASVNVPNRIRVKPVKSGTTTTLTYSISVDGVD